MSCHQLPCLIFDFDGTLVDTSGDIAAAANHVLRLCGRSPMSTAEIMAHVGAGAGQLVKGILPERSDDEIPGLLRELQDYYRRHPVEHSRLYPGMAQVLAALPRERLAVVTNKPEEITKVVVRALDLHHHFATILGARADRPLKPDPAPVHLAMGTIGADPTRTAMVGDGRQDMTVARRAGITALGVAWGFNSPATLRAEGARRILEEPAELLEWWRTEH